MAEQQPLFELIDASEVPKTTRKKREPKTEPRNQTTWWALTTYLAECKVPRHDEVQDTLNPGQQAYRRKYGRVKMVAEISGVEVCRDCFIASADKT